MRRSSHRRFRLVAKTCALGLVALVPLLTANPTLLGIGTYPLLVDMVELPRACAIIVLVYAGCIAWAIAEWQHPQGVRVDRSWLLLAAFAAISTVSAVFSRYPEFAFTGRWFHYEGLLTLLAYSGACFLLAQAFDGRFAVMWVRVGAVVGGLVAFYGGLQSFGLDHANWLALTFPPTRSFSTWSNPDFFGGYLLFPLAYSLGLSFFDMKRSWRKIGAVCSALVLFALVSSLTRAAWLVGAAVAAAMLVLAVRNGAKWSKLLVPGVAALAVAVASVAITSDGQLWSRTVSAFSAADSGTGGRIEIWRESAPYALSNALLGSGPDTFQRGLFDAGSITAPPDDPHQLVLYLLVTIGVPGTVSLLGFALAVLYRSRPVAHVGSDASARMALAAIWVSVVGHGAYLMTGMSLPGSTALLFASLGMLAASISRRSSAPRTATATAAAAAIVLLSVGLYAGARGMIADNYYLEARRAARAGVDSVVPAEQAVRFNPLNPRYQQELRRARDAE